MCDDGPHQVFQRSGERGREGINIQIYTIELSSTSPTMSQGFSISQWGLVSRGGKKECCEMAPSPSP